MGNFSILASLEWLIWKPKVGRYSLFPIVVEQKYWPTYAINILDKLMMTSISSEELLSAKKIQVISILPNWNSILYLKEWYSN